MRSLSFSGRRSQSRKGQTLVGAMSMSPSGYFRSRPREKTWTSLRTRSVGRSRPSRPSSRMSSRAQGFCVMKESGPASKTTPPSLSLRTFPPAREEDSKRVTSGASFALRSS